MKWVVDDAMNLKFADGSFDLVIDKGTLDTHSVLQNATIMVATYLKEVMRVLDDRGVYVCISYDTALLTAGNHFPHLGWDMQIIERKSSDPRPIEDDFPHYIFLCNKTGPEQSQKALAMWPDFQKALA